MNDLYIVKEFRLKLYPKDFDKVRDFYENTLQFIVTSKWDHGEFDRGVMFSVGGTTLELLTPENGYRHIEGCGLSLEVADVFKLYDALLPSGCMTRGLKDNPWGDTSFRIHDPEGFAITFFTKHVTK